MRQQTFLVSAVNIKTFIKSVVNLAIARRVVVRKEDRVYLDLPVGAIGIASIVSPLIAGLSVLTVLVRQFEVDVYHK